MIMTNNNVNKKTVYKMNEEVNGNEVSWNIDKNEEDLRRMITRTAGFSRSEEAAIQKENKNMQWRSTSVKTWKRK